MPDKPADLSLARFRQLSDAVAGMSERSGQQFRSLTTLMVGLDARLDAIEARLDAIDAIMRDIGAESATHAGIAP